MSIGLSRQWYVITVGNLSLILNLFYIIFVER